MASDEAGAIEFRRESVDSHAARRLIAALDAELAALYPEPGTPCTSGSMRPRCAADRVCSSSPTPAERPLPAARAYGARRILLETGPRQPAAIALYARAGYAETDAFGEYEPSPLSTFMAKDL